MVFVKRNEQNKISALFKKASNDVSEELAMEHPEVLLFLVNCLAESKFDISVKEKVDLLKSDLNFIRVLEDLIQILMEKNIISITDFPVPVIEKLVERNKIRKLFQNVGGLIDKD